MSRFFQKFLQLVTSKTVLGAALTQVPAILSNPKDPNTWAQSGGIVLAAAGARDAITKAANVAARVNEAAQKLAGR